MNVDAGGHIENIYYFGIVDEYWSDFVDYNASGQYVTSSGGSDYYYDDFYSPVIAYSATDRSFSIEFSAQEKSTVDYSGAFGVGGYEYYQQSYRPLYYYIEYVVDAGPKANYSVTVVSPPVPEPSAWMLMLLGFTGVGLGLRHRRHAPRSILPSAFSPHSRPLRESVGFTRAIVAPRKNPSRL